MGLLDKILSLFSGGRDTDTQTSKKFDSQERKDSITLGQLKTWIEINLPPLSYQRIILRVTKDTFLKYNIFLNEQPDSYVLPDGIFQQIENTVRQLYKKDININK